MIKIITAILLFATGTVVSIYSLSVPATDMRTLNINNFKNKKLLLVNTASNGSGTAQLTQLEALYQLHKDSLVIIAFPSNSFGNEDKTNPQLDSFMHITKGISFPVAAKSWVRGDSANIIYQWLGSKIQNEVADFKVKRDYQKFLINKDGELVGKFDSVVNPLDSLLQKAIRDN